MPAFRYKGYGPGGEKAAGVVEAEGETEALRKLKAMGLHPRELKESSHDSRFSLRKGPDPARLPAIARQLSVLLGSGVPLVDALRALEREGGGRWRKVLGNIREGVMQGAGLSRALEVHGDVFPAYFTSMVQAGERSGTLDRVLGNLADYLERQARVRDKVQTAMLYPIFMLSVATVVLAFLFAFVVPKIVTIFENANTELPLATKLLIAISGVFTGYWWLILGAAVALGYAGRGFFNKQRGRVDAALMRVFGELYLSRFSMTLAFLLEGGLPMLKALELAGETSGNIKLGDMADKASALVSEGAGLSTSLEGLPPVLLELVSTGEKSGMLTDVLRRAAASYEAEFDRKVQRTLALLEPTMILLMGMAVAFIVFSVLLPLFELNQIIK